jgi:hypothetical protein
MGGELRRAGQALGIDAARKGPLIEWRVPQQILAIEENRWCPESKPGVIRWKCVEVHFHKDGLAPDDGKGLLEASTHRR